MKIGFTDQLKMDILSHYFTDNTELYVGLFVNTGQVDNDPVELVIGTGAGDYTRKQVSFGVPNGALISNNQPITWNTASYDWTPNNTVITHLGIFDNDGSNMPTTGTNPDTLEGLLVFLPLSQSESVLTGNTFVLNTDAIRLQLV